MKKTRIIQIIREEIERVMNETPIHEEDINEMATFYKIKGDKDTAKAALKTAKEKYKEGTALYNTLDTLEKKGEIDYKALSQETGKDIASYNNPKSRGVLEKDLADFIEFEASKRGRTSDPNKPKSEKKAGGKKGRPSTGTAPKKKKLSSTSKLEKKYYVDPEDGGPSNKELKNLSKSGIEDTSMSLLQQQEKRKMLKAALKDLEKQGIVDKANRVLDKEAFTKEMKVIQADIAEKLKDIK